MGFLFFDLDFADHEPIHQLGMMGLMGLGMDELGLAGGIL